MSACTCGRSPTDNCVGWHNLTEDKYLEKKAAHEARKAEKAKQPPLGVSLIVRWPHRRGLLFLPEVKALFLKVFASVPKFPTIKEKYND